MNLKNTVLNLLITTKRIVVKRTRTILAFWSQIIKESSESNQHLPKFPRATKREERVAKSRIEGGETNSRLALLTKERIIRNCRNP